MVAAVEDPAREIEDALHGAGHAGRDRLHTASQRLLSGALDEQVQMVALHGVVHDAEATALADLPQAHAQLASDDERKPWDNEYVLSSGVRC